MNEQELTEKVYKWADILGVSRKRIKIEYEPTKKRSVHFPFGMDEDDSPALPSIIVFGNNVDKKIGDHVIVHELLHEKYEKEKFSYFPITELPKDYIERFEHGLMFDRREKAHQFLYERFLDALALEYTPELEKEFGEYRCCKEETKHICEKIIKLSKTCKGQKNKEKCVESGVLDMLHNKDFDVVLGV